MKDLDWFHARELGKQRQAIRRSGWNYWLIFRAFTWLRIWFEDGIERRRVVQATDFRDSEFLAKDWTNETYEGLPFPPCSSPPTDSAKLLSSGKWTITPNCAGDGTGGNIIPVGGPGVTAPALAVLEVTGFVSNIDLPLTPTGGDCWTGGTPPASPYVFWVAARVGPGMPVMDNSPDAYIFLQWSEALGADLSGVATEWGQLFGGATRGVQITAHEGPGDAGTAGAFGPEWNAAGWPSGVTGPNAAAVPYILGRTYRFRADYQVPYGFTNAGKIYTALGSYTTAGACL